MKISRPKIPQFSFDFLLGAIFILLLATPLIEVGERPLGPALFALLLFAGAYATSFLRWHLVVSAVLGVPWVILSVMKTFAGVSIPQIYPRALFVVFVFYTMSVILSHIVRQSEVTRNLISGGITVYFLFAIGWAGLYSILEFVTPGSISFSGPASTETFSEYLYFSIATMTTLGYGDIIPVSPLARMLAGLEAAVGLLFIGVFIAGMVSRFKK